MAPVVDVSDGCWQLTGNFVVQLFELRDQSNDVGLSITAPCMQAKDHAPHTKTSYIQVEWIKGFNPLHLYTGNY